MITDTIKTEIWEDIPDRPGRTRHVSQVPLIQVYLQVNDLLKEKGLLSKMDYFDASFSNVRNRHELFPYSRWVSAYPVIGDNEGHYIYADAICICEMGTGKFIKERQTVFVGKTHEGFDAAAEIASYIASLFNK